MRWRRLLCTVALVGVSPLLTRSVVSQEKVVPTESEQTERPGAPADTESLVETWVGHAMPSEHHTLLGKLVGEWKMAVKYRMNAEAPVVESEGACTRKWILGRRFVLEEFDGGNLGMPFQGMALYGYDAFEDKYTSVWVDTTSTAMTRSFGTCQSECKLIAFTGRHGDPWTGTMRDSRGLNRLDSDDRHALELYELDSSGKEYRVLEIIYTRAVPPSAKSGADAGHLR